MVKRRFRIAYLSYDGLTDPLGQSQILPYILGLEARGFEFSILSFEKTAALRINQEIILELIKGKRISWIPLVYHKNPPIISTLFDLWLLWRTLKKHHALKQFQAVHCRSYLTSLIGLKAKKKHGLKFIFDMRGFWADERVEGGLWKLGNPVYRLVYRFFKRKEMQFLTCADHVISLTENAKQEILSRKLQSSPITVIPTCVDLELFNPTRIGREDQERLRSKLGIRSDDFVLLYLGSWGTWYLTNEILDFFFEVKKRRLQARLLIVSGDKIHLTEKNESDIIVTSAPRSLVPLYISLADASVFFIKPSFSKKASSATKMGEILAMNVPVVLNGGWGDVDKIKEELGDRVLIYDFSTQSCNEILSQLFSKTNYSRHSDHSNFLESISIVSGVDRYEAVYCQIAD